MQLHRSKLYFILLAVCTAGYAWLSYALATLPKNMDSAGVCLFKHGTGIPCPSCGSTRSVVSLLQGDVLHALYINPLGPLVFLIMLITPLWIMYDLATGQSSLVSFYRKTEQTLKKPVVAFPMIALVLINWTWNIIKGL